MLDRIRAEMGDEVAQIVEDLSDSLVDTSSTEKEDWEVRKPRYLATLAQAQRASCTLFAGSRRPLSGLRFDESSDPSPPASRWESRARRRHLGEKPGS
jgi:hypothetical protein